MVRWRRRRCRLRGGRGCCCESPTGGSRAGAPGRVPRRRPRGSPRPRRLLLPPLVAAVRAGGRCGRAAPAARARRRYRRWPVLRVLPTHPIQRVGRAGSRGGAQQEGRAGRQRLRGEQAAPHAGGSAATAPCPRWAGQARLEVRELQGAHTAWARAAQGAANQTLGQVRSAPLLYHAIV